MLDNEQYTVGLIPIILFLMRIREQFCNVEITIYFISDFTQLVTSELASTSKLIG